MSKSKLKGPPIEERTVAGGWQTGLAEIVVKSGAGTFVKAPLAEVHEEQEQGSTAQAGDPF